MKAANSILWVQSLCCFTYSVSSLSYLSIIENLHQQSRTIREIRSGPDTSALWTELQEHPLFSGIPGHRLSDGGDFPSRAEQLTQEFADDRFASRLRAASYNVSDTCLNHTEQYLEALLGGGDDLWAYQMFDATGKISSGVLKGHFLWSGDYDECQAVVASHPNSTSSEPPFVGKYCSVTSAVPLNIGPNGTKTPITESGGPLLGLLLQIGICLPDSCSDADAKALVETGISLLPVNLSALPVNVSCSRDHDFSSDTRAIAVVCLGSVLCAILIAGTAYDLLRASNGQTEIKVKQIEKNGNPVIQKEIDDESLPLLGNRTEVQQPVSKPGTAGKLLLAFSLHTNAKKLLSTKQGEGSLRCLNGVRFLSMSWVILGHTFAFTSSNTINLVTYTIPFLGRLSAQAVANGTYSVDSFFLLSGLLVTYLTMKELTKGEGKLNWFLYYFHRYWRLTPAMALTMMVYIPLFQYWGSGPFYPQEGIEVDYCAGTWWTNLLYVNNLVKNKQQCMGWTWYLANDMQFYVISPLILLPLYYSSVAGSAILAALLLGCLVASGVISTVDKAGSGIFTGIADQTVFRDMYITPWCRIGPYLVGMALGYVLYRTNSKVNIPKPLVLVGWVLATATGLAVIYGMKGVNQGDTELDQAVSSLYNSTSRTAWGMALGWLIFACCTGNGGFINHLLSLDVFVPMSRLTYCAYLVHPVIMFWFYYGQKTPLYLTDVNVVYYFFGHLVSSYSVAFVASLAFEAPMMGLEKVLLRRERRS